MDTLNINSGFDVRGNGDYNNFKNDYHSEISLRRDKLRTDKDTSNIELGDPQYVGEKWNRYDCLSPLLSKLYGGLKYQHMDKAAGHALFYKRILNELGRENLNTSPTGNCAAPILIDGKRRPPFDNPGVSLHAELEQLCLQLHYTSLPPPINHVGMEGEGKPEVIVDDIMASVLTSIDKQIHRLSLIHTLPPVLTPAECRWVIDTSEKHTKAVWFDSNTDPRNDLTDDRKKTLFKSFNTYDKELLSIPTVAYYLSNIVHQFIIPEVEDRYGIAQGRLGMNELYIVRVDYMGTTAMHEFLGGMQFGFIIPLNEEYSGGRFLLTCNNDEYMEDNDGSLYPDKITEITRTQREQRAAIRNNSDIKLNPNADWRTGVRNLVINSKEMSDMVGSVYIFSSKTMLHKDTVTGGTRYAIVGQLGYGSYYACNWYDKQIEEKIYGSNIYDPEHQGLGGVQAEF